MLDQAIDTVRTRWQRVHLLRATFLLLAAAAAGAVVLAALDNLLHLGRTARIALDAALVTGILGLAFRFLLWPLVRPLTREEAAILLERTYPSLDNRLINAERLAKEGKTPKGFLQLLRSEAAAIVSGLDPRGVMPWRSLRRLALVSVLLVGVLGGYAAALPDYFMNALSRYASPGAFIPPITRTKLRVVPGDARVVEGSTVAIKAEVSGEIPSAARVVVGGAKYEMRFTGEHFVFEFRNVDGPFRYAVEAGDAESDSFQVDVLRRARVARLRLEYRYPDYLELPARVEDPAGGHIAAVEGTRVSLALQATKPLKSVHVAATEGTPLRGMELDVVKSGSYRFEWIDGDGLEGRSPTYTVTSLKDLPPLVKLLEPARNMSVRAEASFSCVVQASDDFGLASVALFTVRGKGERAPLSDLPIAPREIRASRLFKVAELGAAAGETIGLLAVAKDRKGNESTSETVYLRIVDDATAKEEILKEMKGIVARLREALVRQKKVKEQTAAAKPDREALYKEQYGILKTLAEIYSEWTNPDTRHLAARGRLGKVIEGPAVKAVKEIRSDLAAAAGAQGQVISELEAIIAEIEGLMASIQKGDLAKALADASEKTVRQEAKDLLAGLKEFMSEQKKVIQESMDLKRKAPEDLTDEDKKRLETLRQTEEAWGKFFQEKVTDLSKLPPQDFSNGSVLKELNEAFSEVKLAADALNKKAVEMAIPHEESGLELAKSITENIERWLADAPDNLKWNMEEPTKDVEVPMADLPEELEDLIGDLLDKEDQLAEDSQDVTSSWMDSLNQGAGWTAADGPISNMSAKGVTGNLQPNSNEVGGRSGEGRSGKSSGQMVEESASGKGGKQTPTRSTPDPYEAGRVKDTSKDPSGGSTGGGKVSGSNKEGLRGVPPPEIQQKMDRLADRQADIRNTTEKVKVAMEKRGYTSQDLAKALELMRQLEEKLRSRQGAFYDAEAKAIAEQLDALRKTIKDQMDVTRDPTKSISKEKRDQLVNSMDEEIPDEFRDWVKEYYRSLSEK
ncbi:MAG: hypothetical protein HYY17_00710 [Planctomycetes bacterium]|nr:hypothetical protein [Planctomycetota bacterium]